MPHDPDLIPAASGRSKTRTWGLFERIREANPGKSTRDLMRLVDKAIKP